MSDPFSGRSVDPQLVPGALRGFRTWRLQHFGSNKTKIYIWALGSQGITSTAIKSPDPKTADALTWHPGVNEAVCLRHFQVPAQVVPSLTGSGIAYISPTYEFPEPCPDPPGERCCKPSIAQWIGHGCGFYALHQADDPTIQRRFGSLPIPQMFAFGTIKATGRIIVGTEGFRAQKAEVEALCHSDEGVRESLSEQYGVPVFADLNEFREAYPPIPVDELIGPPPEAPFREGVWVTGTTYSGGTIDIGKLIAISIEEQKKNDAIATIWARHQEALRRLDWNLGQIWTSKEKEEEV